jgi:hypothetical protein
MANHLYLFDLNTFKWSAILSREHLQPLPRFAHQFCFDAEARVFYLFGGNPGDPNDHQERLGDFWRMTLGKTATLKDIRQQCILDIRIHQYF